MTNEILVCGSDNSWDVAVIDDDIELATVWWFGTKAAAIAAARQLFDEYTAAKELRVREGSHSYLQGSLFIDNGNHRLIRVESPRAGTFKTIRRR